MTPERLAEIKARAMAATPDWLPTSTETAIGTYLTDDAGNRGWVIIIDVPTVHYGIDRTITQCRTDTDFILNARQDIPALIAEIERLQSENAALREVLETVYAAGPRQWRRENHGIGAMIRTALKKAE